MSERYSIEVGCSYVIVHGTLTIKECFDLLIFFEKIGFEEVITGDQDSTLYLTKKTILDFEEPEQEHETEQEQYNIYEILYEKSEQKVDQLNKKVFELESLLKRLMEDSIQTQSPEQENN